MAFRIEENGQFRGVVTFLNAKLQDQAILNKHVAENAGLAASKLEHQHRAIYAQESATAAAGEARVVHVVKGTTGQVMSIEAGCVVAIVDDASIEVDLLKNGASILTEKIALSDSQSAYDVVAGVIDDEDLLADDLLEIDIAVDASGGTLGKGVFAYVDIHEDVD